MNYLFFWAIALFSVLPASAIAQSFSDTTAGHKPSYWAYESLRLPDLSKTSLSGVITVAVVDDGFNVNHQALKNYIYKNQKEIPGNGIDDDKNGYTDDISGWDAADKDNNVSIPLGRESFFYHGTMVAGAIAMVAEKCFGSGAAEHIKIIPVKVMGDKSQKPYFEEGYDGIAYAVKLHADIIVCAWSGGKYDKEKYHSIFDEAEKNGILVLASAGNFYSGQIDPPASIATVYVVAGLDTALRKLPASNYGLKVDLSAPGYQVCAPHPQKDHTFAYNDGSSAAVSLVAGCAAVLKALQPNATGKELMAALINTAIPVDSQNRYYGGKLGAGRPDLNTAVKYLHVKTGRDVFFSTQRPKGDISVDNSSPKKDWDIAPNGGFSGFYFGLNGNWNAGNQPVKFFCGDSLVASYLPKEFPAQVFIKCAPVRVSFEGRKGKEPSVISYSSSPIDSTILYCSDTRYYENPEDEFGDGSGTAEYANNCACKWQISVPQGKRIKLEFDELDTQANTDFVWIFDGTGTLQENIIAKFSGSKLPPIIVSKSNKILVWFVTDKEITGKGWHLHYTATDEQPGVVPQGKH